MQKSSAYLLLFIFFVIIFLVFRQSDIQLKSVEPNKFNVTHNNTKSLDSDSLNVGSSRDIAEHQQQKTTQRKQIQFPPVLISDQSEYLAEAKRIHADSLPTDPTSLVKYFNQRNLNDQRFVSPYYEELSSHTLSKIISRLLENSDLSEKDTLWAIQEISKTLVDESRDPTSQLDDFIKKLAFAINEKDSLKDFVLGVTPNENEVWLANLKGTLIGLDINQSIEADDRIRALSNVLDDLTKSYAERTILRGFSWEANELGRLYFLDKASMCIEDQALIKSLFPNADEQTLDLVLKSENINNRNLVLTSLASKAFYSGSLDEANKIIESISDPKLKADATRNVSAAQLRRKALTGKVPINAPPGIFE